MTAQPIDRQHRPGMFERVAARARSVTGWIDSTAFRSQLGPTRDPERREFIPARRR